MINFWTNPEKKPQIIADHASYLVLYKPPCIHTAPLLPGEENTLLSWAASLYPEVVRIRGQKPVEGGLIHRLDYETHGLVLCAKTQKAYEQLMVQQKAGKIVKEYDAVSRSVSPIKDLYITNNIIQSAFRPYGKGRKAVRPVEADHALAAGKNIYQTEILLYQEIMNQEIMNTYYFRLRIKKGFRHQIRCHLAWIGRPLLNDFLYGSSNGTKSDKNAVQSKTLAFLALRASSIAFSDPVTGKSAEITIPSSISCPEE